MDDELFRDMEKSVRIKRDSEARIIARAGLAGQAIKGFWVLGCIIVAGVISATLWVAHVNSELSTLRNTQEIIWERVMGYKLPQ